MEEYKEMEMDSHLFVFNDLAGKCGVMILTNIFKTITKCSPTASVFLEGVV